MADRDPFELTRGSTKGRVIGSKAANTPEATGGDEELDRFQRLKNQVYARYFRAIEQDDKYYRKEFGADILPREWRDEGFKATIPPTGHLAVESASEHILTTPRITVPPRPVAGEDLDERLIADDKQQALKFFWHNVFMQGDPLGHGKKKMVKDGKMVLKVEVDWDLVDPDADMFGLNQFLWRARLAANDTILEDPDNPHDPMYVYESWMMRISEAKRLFPDAKGDWTAPKRQPTDTVRYVEYWSKPTGTSKGKRIVWIDNERVIDKANPYRWEASVTTGGSPVFKGFVPYAIADSSWGDVGSENMPHERYVGILRYMHDILETEARQLTAAEAQMRIATFPPIKMWNVPHDPDHPFRFGPAAVIRFNGDKGTSDAEVMNMPQLPAGVIDILNRTHTYANELSRFNTLGGGAQRGVDTATEADLNVRNASSRLSGPVSGIQMLITRVNEMVLQTVENILETPVVLYGAAEGGMGSVTLTPESINGFYMTFVQLQTTEQAALDRALLKTWADAYRTFAPAMDPEFAMRQVGIESATERVAKGLDFQVLNHPMMQEQRVAKALGLGEGVSAIMQLRALQGIEDARDGGTPEAGFTPPQNVNTGAAAEAAVVTDGRDLASALRPDLARA